MPRILFLEPNVLLMVPNSSNQREFDDVNDDNMCRYDAMIKKYASIAVI